MSSRLIINKIIGIKLRKPLEVSEKEKKKERLGIKKLRSEGVWNWNKVESRRQREKKRGYVAWEHSLVIYYKRVKKKGWNQLQKKETEIKKGGGNWRKENRKNNSEREKEIEMKMMPVNHVSEPRKRHTKLSIFVKKQIEDLKVKNK